MDLDDYTTAVGHDAAVHLVSLDVAIAVVADGDAAAAGGGGDDRAAAEEEEEEEDEEEDDDGDEEEDDDDEEEGSGGGHIATNDNSLSKQVFAEHRRMREETYTELLESIRYFFHALFKQPSHQ